MPECRYCGEAFDDEGGYHDHLREEHADELGPIDRRRLDGGDGGFDVDLAPIALIAVIGVSAAVVAYVIFFAGGGGSGDADLDVARTPHDLRSVHYHGTMVVEVDGERIDFSRSEYQLRADAFHFEGGDGTRWHVHARGVTLEYALATLGIEVSADRVAFEGGRAYDGDDPNVTVSVEVDGEPVEPASYVLEEGDDVEVVVRTG